MTSKLGCHWLREHPDQFDFPHIEAMQYKSIKPFKPLWDNRDACANLLAVLPRDSYILARDHGLSEQKEEMWSKPEEHGKYHADEWMNKVRGGTYHLPIDRTFFLGINEPDATNGDRNAIDIYTAAFLDRLRAHGFRGGAFNFSTGHPRTVDGTPNTQADYSVFERSHQAIVKGHHIGVLHIYGTGAVPCAPGHYDRLKACTWQDVEWVVGEFGVDEHVIGGGAHDGFHEYFNGRLDDYCGWLDTAIIGINDPRIHSYQVFTYDFSHPWDSFDTHPIRAALESYQWQHTKQQPPSPGPVGSPPMKPTPAWIIAPAGARLRDVAATGATLVVVPYGSEISIIGVENIPGWMLVRYGDKAGYMAAHLIGLHAPEPLPAPPQPPVKPVEPAPSIPTGIVEPRVAQAILKVESGGRTHGEDGRIIIRFEAHIFKRYLGNDALFDQHFRYDQARPWVNQQWRRVPSKDTWQLIHTGKQADEWSVLEFANKLNTPASFMAISMGAAQIMGFNFARIGYPSAADMFVAFRDPLVQTIGFINFFLSDPALADAMRNKDWRTIAAKYNGSGAVDTYAPLLEKAYKDLGGT